MKNRILNIGLALLALLFVVACSEDDFTGDSTMRATAPNLSVDLDFNNTETLVEDGSSYNFTVSISEPQIADVVVYLTQTGGDATEGDDFTFPHTVTIPKGSTSASGTITILSDDLKEENESVEITIGTGMEANVATVNSETVTFNIGNLEEGELMVNLSWEIASTTTDNEGNSIDATALADMRLLLTDVPYENIVIEEDGSGFESLTVSDTLADGEYYLVADFFDAMDLVRDLNLTLTFDQIGVINHETYSFAEAIDTKFICEANFVILAKVIKSGDSYQIEEINENNFRSAQVSWDGIDVYDFYAPDGWPSHIVTGKACEGNTISGLNEEWILEVWGEEIQERGTVYYTIADDGTVTIEEQYIFTTLYDGSLYDYTVTGTGTYDDSGDTPMIHLEYKLIQDGFDVAEYWNSVGGMDTPYFVADIFVAN